jgi:hypothetical protein
MRVKIEIWSAPPEGGTLTYFERRVAWEIIPRVGDHVRLLDESSAAPRVERVTFGPGSTIHVALAEPTDDSDEIHSQLVASRYWREAPAEVAA